MPLVKASVPLVSNDICLIDSDLHSVALVTLCRQISELALSCDVLIGELVTEVEKIAGRTQSLTDRTTKLAVKLDSLDDNQTSEYVGSITADKTLVRRCSVTDYKSRDRRTLFTPSTRPDSVRVLYQQCLTSPVDLIAECDVYRTDGRRGATIFSPAVFCLYDHPTDDFLTVCRPSVVKRRHTLGRSLRSLRPSNRTRPTSLPITTGLNFLSDFGREPSESCTDDVKDTSNDAVSLRLEPERVCIDVSGSNFIRQMAKYPSPIVHSTTVDTATIDNVRNRKSLSSWRRTICDVTDLVFPEIDAQDPAYMKSLSSSLSSARSKASATRKTSCSWRQSLKSLIRGVRMKSIDLWAPDSSSIHQKSPPFRRSNSLPRSMKSKVNGNENFPTAKSKSVEGQLNVTVDDRPISATLSRSRRSLASRSRGGRPKSMEVHIVSLDEFGKPCYEARGNDEVVHVNIPEQPWTKPFANVKLRTRTTRAESEKYQSSSGHWSGEQSFEAEVERSSMTSLASGHVNDSAVSLSCDVGDSRVTKSAMKTSSDDCLTLKACSSTSTIISDLHHLSQAATSGAATENVYISCFPARHNRQFADSQVVSLSTFRRTKKVNLNPEAQRVNDVTTNRTLLSRIPPVPPIRTASTMQKSDCSENTLSELEKLASLAKKMAAFKVEASGFKSKPVEQFFADAKTLCIVAQLKATESSNQVVTTATVTSQVVQRKVINRNCSRDTTLSLIAEGSDETDEHSPDCNESLTAATWPRHHEPTKASSAAEPNRESAQTKTGDCESPVPVSARLIISSPVASRACFVDNPHRRAVCQPIRDNDQPTTVACDVETSDCSDVGVQLKPELPISTLKVTIPSNYGRSWYDGLLDPIAPADVTENNRPSKYLHFMSLPRHLTGFIDIECHLSDTPPSIHSSDTPSISSQDSSSTSTTEKSSGSDKSFKYADLNNGQVVKPHKVNNLLVVSNNRSAGPTVNSVKQYKARSVKTRQSFTRSGKLASYNVAAASQSRSVSLSQVASSS